MDFKQKLENYQKIINEELEKYMTEKNCPEKMLYQAMKYSVMAGGKRLRPILVIATYQLFNEDIEKCMPYAIAIEMVHNSSLIHDDLPGIDNDDIRHGKPTNHKQFNEATAILAGDTLQNKPYEIISQDLMESKPEELSKKIRVLEEFAQATKNMLSGQFLDTQSEGKSISEETLKYIHQNKTGAFLKLCVRMGAILAKASEKDIENLSIYAEKIGLAFQIKDDILSEEGDEKTLGKPVGNDKKLEKCTYVAKYGLENAKEILRKTTKEAIARLEQYGQKAEFLKELALYIENRNK